MSEYGEGIFLGDSRPSLEKAMKMYAGAKEWNARNGVEECCATNENFFLGRQWEGVNANGLPTPVFNILKRDVLFVVSSITSENLSVRAEPMGRLTAAEKHAADLVQQELERLCELNDVPRLARRMARDAAVRGDGCLYTYWDTKSGRPVTECIENTRVFFGNPCDREVEHQSWIMVERRQETRLVRKRAREGGQRHWQDIRADAEGDTPRPELRADGMTTVILLMYREEGRIWGYEFCPSGVIRDPFDMGLVRYPICWLNWDYVTDSYHGQAMITGLIPNQIFINKAWAMSMLSLMTTAYPKVIYDKTRIPQWDNRVGAAIAVAGGDMDSVAKILDPAQVSPQIAAFIEMAIEETNRNLGANNASLGDVSPDNTSAILALQRAAATPSEITKQNLRACLEDLMRIYVDFMAGFLMELGDGEFAPGLRSLPLRLRLDVGASTYFSELAAVSCLEGLLKNGLITAAQYLERLPQGYVPDRDGLLREMKGGEENGGE